MYIERLAIRNFRNFKNGVFLFKEGVNTIIGENGSGKTNAFFALRLLLDDSLPDRAKKLKESDFNRDMGSWRGHWIVIKAYFSGLGFQEISRAMATYSTGTMDDQHKGTYSLIFRPNRATRQKLFELSQDKKKTQEKLKTLLSEISIEDYEAEIFFRGKTDFDIDSEYKKCVGDFETITFPNPEDALFSDLGVPPIKLLTFNKHISCTFIMALRDVVSSMKQNRSNPLLELLRDQEKTVSIEKAAQIRQDVQKLNNDIGELSEVRQLATGISKTIDDAIGSTYAPSIEIKSELPEEIDQIFRALTIWVGDQQTTSHVGQLHELSLGGANLVYLSLKLYEYEKARKMDKVAHFLLIEEPEAHIHTHIQKSLFRNIKLQQTQVFLTTHSTHISEVSRISAMNVLSIKDNSALVFQPANGLDPLTTISIERYLDAIRSNILFAKGIVLVEGDAEAILIPAMFEKVMGISLDELGVSLINMNSAVFTHVATLFHEDRIKKKCAIITDLDASLLKLSSKPELDSPAEKDARASEKSGKERKEGLENEFKDNEYVDIFYADHTFEADLFLAENVELYKSVLTDLYKKSSTIKEMKEKFDNKDKKMAAYEGLCLAERTGKGWFALKVANHLSEKVQIPYYILSAIAFSASSHVNDTILRSIVKKGLTAIEKREIERKFLDQNIDKICDYVDETHKKSNLNEFLNLLRWGTFL